MTGYRGLKVYEASYGISIEIYKMTGGYPKDEEYGMSNQMRRAAISIPMNIAEGYGKKESKAEFKRYLMMAKGSCNEMQVLMDISRDVGYITEEEHDSKWERYDEIARMLNGLIKSCE